MRKAHLTRVLALLALSCACASVGYAEDIKGKWYVGGQVGVDVYTDNVRSNAALIISPLGEDGAPFTGDEGEIVACDAEAASVYCDPRPDDLIARETQLEDTLEAKATVGYGLTSMISLQLDVGYYKGSVNNFDVFTTKRVPFGGDDQCVDVWGYPCYLYLLRTLKVREPISAGDVTLNPVELNALVRFRKDSNFNPYIGLGIGYLFSNIDVDRSVDDLNDRLEGLNIISVTDEFGRDFGTILTVDPNTNLPKIYGDGNAPFDYPVSVEIEDGLQWQVMGGGEYFFNDRLSMVFDARYTIAGHEISILMNGQDQINVQMFPEEMFWPDGSVKIWMEAGGAPNTPIDPNNPTYRYDCDPDDDQDIIDNLGEDYDGNGLFPDLCFDPASTTRGEPSATVVVQGGTIRMTHFTFGFGIRFTF